MGSRSVRWEPPREREARRALLARLETHLESLHSLGFEVGQGAEVIDFLASLRDMGVVETLLHGAPFTARERERVLNLVEERMGELSPKTRWRSRFRRWARRLRLR